MEFAQLPLSTDISSTAAAASIDLQKSGLLYISRIPPKMTPSILRQLLQPYGSIGRIYLVPKGSSI